MSMSSLNIIDIIILAIIALSVVVSFIRGSIKEILSVVTWVAAIFFAVSFSSSISVLLVKYTSNSTVRSLISIVIIFVAVFLLGYALNSIFSFIISKTGLGPFDRILGMVFGFVRGLLIVTVVIFLANRTSFNNTSYWKQSEFAPDFVGLAEWLHQQFYDNDIDKIIPQKKTLKTK